MMKHRHNGPKVVYCRSGKVFFRERPAHRVSPKCNGRPLNKPWKSDRKFKKKQVCVRNKKGNVVNIHFGDRRYEDYTQHKDKERRRNFRSRHGCDPVKNLDKSKPKYWACQNLW